MMRAGGWGFRLIFIVFKTNQNRACKETLEVCSRSSSLRKNEDLRSAIAFIVIVVEIPFSSVPINSEQSGSLKDFLVESLNEPCL